MKAFISSFVRVLHVRPHGTLPVAASSGCCCRFFLSVAAWFLSATACFWVLGPAVWPHALPLPSKDLPSSSHLPFKSFYFWLICELCFRCSAQKISCPCRGEWHPRQPFSWAAISSFHGWYLPLASRLSVSCSSGLYDDIRASDVTVVCWTAFKQAGHRTNEQRTRPLFVCSVRPSECSFYSFYSCRKGCPNRKVPHTAILSE